MINLTADHRVALDWFYRRRGETINWPEPLENGLFLVNRPKGIHKPRDWDHALSIRITQSGDYADGDVERMEGGGWRFRYHQEGNAAAPADDEFTNRALLRCKDDGVPIGVLRQVSGKPEVRYEVLGLGHVVGYADGFFTVVGPVETDAPVATAEVIDGFEPSSLEDGRRFVMALVHRRQGQGRFRQSLLRAYDGRCAISGCDVAPLLEAAHILPYRGRDTNIVQNGLLLRTDLHTLFDLGLLRIDPDTLKVTISASIAHPDYASLSGTRLRPPAHSDHNPSSSALKMRMQLWEMA